MLREKRLKQVSTISNLKPIPIFIRYSLLGALLLGLYLLWDENQSLKTTLIQVTNQLNTIEVKNQKLQELLLHKEQIVSQQSKKIIEKEKTLETNNTQEKSKLKKEPIKEKKIVIVLPENEKNYSKIIPKIDYNNIPLEKDMKDIKKGDDLKISPEVFIDKDEKKINGGKIQIETKF
jgi:predicted nuclease with TOPRIM domain